MISEDSKNELELNNDAANIEQSALETGIEKKQRIYTITAKELWDMDIKEVPYLIKPLFPKTGVAALVGSSDTGKSTFLRQLALAVAQKKDSFLGYPINEKHNSVIVVSTEDDSNSTAALLRKQLKEDEIEHLENLRFLFDSENVLAKLKASLEHQPADLVIIDAFADLYSGEMNQANKVRGFLSGFSNLAEKHKCLFIFLHHTGKGKEDLEPSKNNALGSQGFESKMRVMIELRVDLSDSSLRHLCIVKANYLPSSDKERSIVIKMADNMVYSNTGQRVPFGELKKPIADTAQRSLMINRIMELKKEDMSIRQIAEVLSGEGMKAGKTTVGEIIKEQLSVPKDSVAEEDTGQGETE